MESFKGVATILLKVVLFAAAIVLLAKFYGEIQTPSSDNSRLGESIERCPVALMQMDWDAFLDNILFRKQIYRSFNVSQYNGWTNLDKLFERQLERYLTENPALDVVRLIEVGSWKGRSTVAMAAICRRLTAAIGKKCTLLAIDPWTGSTTHFLPYEVGQVAKKMLRENDGIFRLFEIFLQNVKKMQLDDVITPLRLPASAAGQVLSCYQLQADMAYIDGEHDYQTVQSDLAYYDGIVKDDGILFGDDYGWPPVRRAVDEFARQKRLSVEISDQKTWIIRKRNS